MRLPHSYAALLALAAPIAAQSNAERVVNDAYTRSHDYDLVHQRIEVRNFDWDSTSLDGRVTTTLVALRPGLDSVILDAGRLLTVRAVVEANAVGARHAAPLRHAVPLQHAVPLRFAVHGDTLVVYPARPVAFHDTLRFTVEYHARIDNGRGLTFITPQGREHRPQQIWSQGEDHDNHLWFPTYDFPNDKMSWELAATVPAEYSVVSNGRLVTDRKNPGGTHTVTWRQDRPSATYLVSLIVAPLLKFADAWRGVPVDYYVYRADSVRARRLFGVTPDMIDVYSRLTGLKYPWDKYAQTTVADFFGGMENVSATTLVDWLPDDRAYLDRPWYQWILIPHELAHQWFGDYTTTENWANMWLNEGFAEFMPGQYWGAKLGRHAEDDYYLDEYRQYRQIDARRRMPLAAATTDDLRQAVLEATGENLDWFWDEWMYQAGHPQFAVTAAYDTVARKLTLTVKQTQSDSTKADSTGLRYTTPAVFRMPVTVRIGTTESDVVKRVDLTAREQTVEVANLPGAPTMVAFDDGNTILKDLTFDQPTAWLATALRRDADLWNRQWAIEQLAQRTADTAAAAALAWAATRSDYFLTRAAACEGLGHFPAGVAQAPLVAALQDTAAQVRRAAVTALGQLSGAGARVAELARATFRGDPSYEVRAAALLALFQADSTKATRDGAVAWGLATPSYQDVIEESAYRIIAQGGDTAAIPALEARLGGGRFPAHVLAALASRGSTHALDVLAAHLDDERRYVRRWVVEAFRFTLAHPLATERLKAVADKLKYADTKQEVGQALEQLAKPGSEDE